MAALLGFTSNLATAWEPLRAHPQNPYILEFREKPTLLYTFGPHYGWLFDSGLNYIPYMDTFEQEGMNLTRIWCMGYPADEAGAFLQPWPRTSSSGNALDGLGKWNFNAWNETYFNRLKAMAQAASDRGIVVEFTFFSSFYEDAEWIRSPFHPSNNVQGYGRNNRYDCFRAADGNLNSAMQAAVRRIVRELNAFDNVYYEVINEPFWNEPGVKDTEEVAFQNSMLQVIRDEESKLPNRHLVAHNFTQKLSSMSSDFDILNEHYPVPVAVPGTPIMGAEALLRDEYGRGKILSLDETSTQTELQTRVESWMFFIGGGGIYDGLDGEGVVYPFNRPAGDNALGRAMRKTVLNAANYMYALDLVSLRRNLSWVTGGVPNGATLQASANTGQQYVAYLHHGKTAGGFALTYDPIDTSNHSASLRVNLNAGKWRAVWTRPSDMAELKTQEFTHAGGNVTLQSVTYQADAALRIDRVEDTPPPVPSAPSAPTGLQVEP